MPSISLTAANLASVCVEGVFFGIFLVLSFLSLRNYSRTYSRGERISQNSAGRWLNRLSLVFMVMTKPMILGTLLLFITVTFHWFCTMIRVFEAFVYYRGGSHPEDYYAYGGQKTYIGTLTSLALSLLIGDLMMARIRRLWHVYEHRWRLVAFPLVTWAGLLGMLCLNLPHFSPLSTMCSLSDLHGIYVITEPRTYSRTDDLEGLG
ncbi:hypothetical protein FISHEDRAFT_51127 [Fistulina hepatica ATCC 64428]|uniref:Uncharacterized protein n=1 Tax=Fistulina hepatica ATCC 64428 TaxID=1128425 RepID=A0A0D7A0C4_9AGAR|nr:hypothetical protein FISHEDRAFT_51127 [Fistulina hepatica ATCC 64428]